MAGRAIRILLAVIVFASPAAARQAATPKLNKAQRETLQAVVVAVDAAATLPATPDAQWQTHLLRTSDGSHYVAFTVTPSSGFPNEGLAALYVRLASRHDSPTVLAERSAVMEWLKGMRSDPLVARKQRGIAFGEMPIFGAGAIATRGPGAQSSDLALLNLERERAREAKQAADKERKAALEGTAARARDALYPFEDFTIDPSSAAASAKPRPLQRSLTAGPGNYDLYVAWAARPLKGRPGPITVVKRALDLLPASSSLSVSSVILADDVTTRDTPYPPEQQSSHPYAIGPMEIAPAADAQFTNDERLTLAFQVMNPRANDAGKPDITIGFQLFRVTPDGDQSVGMLNPQYYNASTLPLDFDVAKGHPLFAAMAAPLKTLPRGDYRLKITATDRLAARSALADTTFRIVATPASLLATAPLASPLQREDLLDTAVRHAAAARLETDRMTPALTAALDALRAARFVDLLREDATADSEHGARVTLRGIGLYALGDPRMAATMLTQALKAAPNAVAELYLGGCRALQGNDREAVIAWQAALDGGVDAAIVVPFLVDAHLRVGDLARAAEIAEGGAKSGAAAILRSLAAVHVAQGRELDAIPALERHLAAHPEDRDGQYALLHALFASYVRGKGPGTTDEGKERFKTLARTYIDAKARHGVVVGEWVGMVGQQ
jgi:tetratricopeptide (TPR) repeat protein